METKNREREVKGEVGERASVSHLILQCKQKRERKVEGEVGEHALVTAMVEKAGSYHNDIMFSILIQNIIILFFFLIYHYVSTL